MSYMTPDRFIRSLAKTENLFRILLTDVTQAQAQTARDGADGWNVIEVVCHLRDFTEIFFNRARMMVEQDEPALPAYDHLALAIEKRYAEQQIGTALQELLSIHKAFLDWLQGLNDAAWLRPGIHPSSGKITVIEQAMQAATHDIDHMEQIVRILNQ